MGRWYSGTGTEHKRPNQSLGTKLRDRVNDIKNGTSRCACGCRQTATAFRGGKMYNSKCVGPGSGWAKSRLPTDRTPPRNHGGQRWWANE